MAGDTLLDLDGADRDTDRDAFEADDADLDRDRLPALFLGRDLLLFEEADELLDEEREEDLEEGDAEREGDTRLRTLRPPDTDRDRDRPPPLPPPPLTGDAILKGKLK